MLPGGGIASASGRLQSEDPPEASPLPLGVLHQAWAVGIETLDP